MDFPISQPTMESLITVINHLLGKGWIYENSFIHMDGSEENTTQALWKRFFLICTGKANI